ncbi:MAG: DUF4296 domain-containing protein [Bacteroidales bacterium]|nr:DUF4296 domain-containing protein [Bacteroidales bacterium]MDT8430632.1 DUF4296 domain-containing protein [Bacteroidales bacterium]
MILNKNITRLAAILLAATILLGSAACKREKKISGKEYIEKEVLVQVLMDMHLMDGITNDMKFYRKFNPGDSIDIYGPIFNKYDIDREMYDRTIKEYSKYPQLMDEVYDQVLMQLNLLQDKIESEEDKKIEVINGRNR